VSGRGLGLVALAGAAWAWRRVRHRGTLRGAVALVTGGSRGLGLLVARELLREGAVVVACGRDADTLGWARRRLADDGLHLQTAQCDVTDRDAVRALVADVTTRHGRVDVVVNVAGEIEVGPFAVLGPESVDRALAVMLHGIVNTTAAVLPQMRARGAGRIVNVTSVGGKVGVPHLAPYCAAKFAATGFSEALGAELARDGIRVTTIVPGLMRTGSFLAARVAGDAEGEASWFGVAASLPGLSMSAERAARQIVAACRRGDAERILGLTAILGARVAGLMPGTTTRLAGLVARLLPGDGRQRAPVAADAVSEALRAQPARALLLSPGFAAAARYQPGR
jgi:NAD(P)-dependent dehydrogenase (short-subunit alcohol dehydrogenase family)